MDNISSFEKYVSLKLRNIIDPEIRTSTQNAIYNVLVEGEFRQASALRGNAGNVNTSMEIDGQNNLSQSSEEMNRSFNLGNERRVMPVNRRTLPLGRIPQLRRISEVRRQMANIDIQQPSTPLINQPSTSGVSSSPLLDPRSLSENQAEIEGASSSSDTSEEEALINRDAPHRRVITSARSRYVPQLLPVGSSRRILFADFQQNAINLMGPCVAVPVPRIVIRRSMHASNRYPEIRIRLRNIDVPARPAPRAPESSPSAGAATANAAAKSAAATGSGATGAAATGAAATGATDAGAAPTDAAATGAGATGAGDTGAAAAVIAAGDTASEERPRVQEIPIRVEDSDSEMASQSAEEVELEDMEN